MDLNIPEQDPVDITKVDVQQHQDSDSTISGAAKNSYSPRLDNTGQNNHGHDRAIACKLLTGIIATNLSMNISQHMSAAQKGIGNNTRGSKHQLGLM